MKIKEWADRVKEIIAYKRNSTKFQDQDAVLDFEGEQVLASKYRL